MFGFGNNRKQLSPAGISQDKIDSVGMGYEKFLNDLAELNGSPLNVFRYKSGWHYPSEGCFVFSFVSEYEMIPEEALIIDEIIRIISKNDENKVDYVGSNEIRFTTFG